MKKAERTRIADLLEFYHDRYNRPGFIEDDPISIPHRYSKIQDIEIMAFFAAILAWGQRPTIIRKCSELAGLMDDDPHAFITGFQPSELKPMESFVHRTFNGTDLLYFLEFLQEFYRKHISLEAAFLNDEGAAFPDIRMSLEAFQERFFSLPYAPARTRKHVASPARNSSCKRLNMFLRWMVRRDDRGVDFGLWQTIPMAALHCPLDVHVERTSRSLGLLRRKQRDWKSVVELTEQLRTFDAEDPARFDFALFGMGLERV